MSRPHVSAESVDLGPYDVDLRVYPDALDPSTTIFYRLGYRAAKHLRDQLSTAIDRQDHRRLVDAVCGDCKQCKNTRMVNVLLPNGHTRLDHCPRCSAKQEKAREKGIL